MSDNAFDTQSEPRQRRPRPDDTTGWRAFDTGGQVAAPASPSPPRRRPRNPYDPGGEVDPRLSTRHSSAPPRPTRHSPPSPAPESPSPWPPMSASSTPRMGAGLRSFSEPSTEEAEMVRQPGSR
ncbi:MAG: hypothetical protein ACRD0P_06370, partial [Stackebrandtia sp.]